MSDNDIRWKQRFQNYERGLALLNDALSDGPEALNPLEQEGLVQRFEYTFELAWKCLKDYLDAGGIIITPVTPRQVLKEAFSAKLIGDGQTWIDMLGERNLLSHTYDPAVFEAAVRAIAATYLPALNDLAKFLREECNTTR